MKYVVVLVAFLALSGCDSTSSTSTESEERSQNAAANSSDGMICNMEKRVGSNMMTRVCRSAEQREDEEEAARAAFFRIQRTGSTSDSGGE